MTKLARLQAELADLKTQATKLLDKAGDDFNLSAEDQEAYDDLKDQIEAKQGQIASAERLAEERRQIDAIPGGQSDPEPGRSPAGSTTVRDLNPATTHGFHDLGEFAAAVREAQMPGGRMDARLAAPTNTHQGGSASGDGFMVPSQYRDEIFEVVTDLDEFGPLVDEEPTAAREVKMNADETTPWSNSGVVAAWRSEGAQMTASRLNTEQRTVPLHQLYAFVEATEELLEDAPRLNARLTRKAGQAIAWKKNAAMIYGTGAGQPLGWFNGGGLITVPKGGAQAADTIIATNVIAMYSRLLSIPGSRPFWLANSDVLPQLMTMTIGDRPIWIPPSGLADGPGGTLLGLPVRLSEHANTLGDKGDIQLVQPMGYYALRKDAGPRFAQSMHLYFDRGIECFRWTFQFGGQPHLSAPVEPAHGNTTKSHFITLAERA